MFGFRLWVSIHCPHLPLNVPILPQAGVVLGVMHTRRNKPLVQDTKPLVSVLRKPQPMAEEHYRLVLHFIELLLYLVGRALEEILVLNADSVKYRHWRIFPLIILLEIYWGWGIELMVQKCIALPYLTRLRWHHGQRLPKVVVG